VVDQTCLEDDVYFQTFVFHDRRTIPFAETNEGKKEIAPGFQIHFAIDSINVNVVQATTGGDSVFNLKLNKLLPTPSICILSLR